MLPLLVGQIDCGKYKGAGSKILHTQESTKDANTVPRDLLSGHFPRCFSVSHHKAGNAEVPTPEERVRGHPFLMGSVNYC